MTESGEENKKLAYSRDDSICLRDNVTFEFSYPGSSDSAKEKEKKNICKLYLWRWPVPFFCFLPSLLTNPPHSPPNLIMSSIQTQAAVAPTGASLYARFALAGAICCGVTHGALTPVGKWSISLFYFFSSL
jgi:hypothetical protein